ncbi:MULTISPECIES: hypothetical protein [unclassified Nocardioides]|nr:MULTISPECIES: hypothetical protein [unclassified Nocardioides]
MLVTRIHPDDPDLDLAGAIAAVHTLGSPVVGVDRGYGRAL